MACSRRDFMRRAGLATAGGVLSATGFSSRAQGPPGSLPNIVFILIDDLGWRDVGCYGSDFYETPNIDRLAARGMRFTNGYAACTVCSPTRASIMTGKYPARLHLTDWISGHKRPFAKLRIPEWTQVMGQEEVTLAELLKPLGYATGFIGKWHLGPSREYWPCAQGFDRNVGGYSRGSPPSYFAPYTIPTMAEGPVGEYLTDRHADDAVAFLADHGTRPFLLYLSMYAVHTPLQAKKNLIAKYERKAAAMPAGAQGRPVYAAMVESMDRCVGRVLEALASMGQLDNTIVFFTGDNGGLIGSSRDPITSNAPLRAGKGSAYEGGVREPFIISWPGVTAPGSVCHTPVLSIDFYPTIREMVGAKGVDWYNRDVDGLSLVPLLRNPSSSLNREAIYWHYPHYHPGGATPYSAVRAGDYKLIEFFEDKHLELYSLRDDIGELHDLSSRQPAKTRELHAMLIAWRQAVGAQLPSPNPDYDPARANDRGGRRQADRAETKHAVFAILRGGNVKESSAGWELSTKGEATALKKLPAPITGRASFKVTIRTRLKREEGWQNGFLALADAVDDRNLVIAGFYIGAQTVTVWHGLSTAKRQAVSRHVRYEREQDLPLTVTVDTGLGVLELEGAGMQLRTHLPKGFEAVRYAGYHAMQTTTHFSAVSVLRDP